MNPEIKNVKFSNYFKNAVSSLKKTGVLVMVMLHALRGATHQSFSVYLAIYLKEYLMYSSFFIGIHLALLTIAGFVFTPEQNVKENVVIRRTTSTHMDIRVYSSDAYTGTAQHYGDVTVGSNITGLQYIMSANGAGTGANHTWSIDNIKVYNDTTSIPPNAVDKIFDSDTSGIQYQYTYPNLPNGSIFEESDTGKHYMWDGTSAWNEIA